MAERNARQPWSARVRDDAGAQRACAGAPESLTIGAIQAALIRGWCPWLSSVTPAIRKSQHDGGSGPSHCPMLCRMLRFTWLPA